MGPEMQVTLLQMFSSSTLTITISVKVGGRFLRDFYCERDYTGHVTLTKEKLEEVIKSGNFEALIGSAETGWFECKSQPYQISDGETARRELAKDVSSFANASGGKILIGLKTKPSATHFGDEVEEVRAFSQGLVNTTQNRDLINRWIYPQIEGVDVAWHPSKADSSQGIVVIDIPQQKEGMKPFLIVKTLDGAKMWRLFSATQSARVTPASHLRLWTCRQR